MIVTHAEVASRFFKIGSGGAVAGAIHILTLLLGWYIETDKEGIVALAGYTFPESFIFSTLGGALAGVGLIAGYLTRRLTAMKILIGGLTVVGGVLASFSPLYVYLFKILAVNVRGYPDLGFFMAMFTGLIQTGTGLLVLSTPLKKELLFTGETPVQGEYILPSIGEELDLLSTPGRAESRGRPARIVAAEDVEEGICTICYYPLSRENSVKCSVCGALFHRDCIDAWASINLICPSCKAVLRR